MKPSNSRLRSTQAQCSVTGRDGYIVAKALAYAIVSIQRLPVRWQEFSDCEDMKLLLEHYFKVLKPHMLADATRHLNGAGDVVPLPAA